MNINTHFSRRAQNVYLTAGITTLEQLITFTFEDLLKLPNFGQKTWNETREVLQEYNLQIRSVRIEAIKAFFSEKTLKKTAFCKKYTIGYRYLNMVLTGRVFPSEQWIAETLEAIKLHKQ
jgi:hypothetical protein